MIPIRLKFFLASLTFLVVLAALRLSLASRTSAGPIPQADAICSSLKSANAPGAAVLVLKNGKAVFEKGYGVRNVRTREPINATTNFRLASVTKQFTAMAIMLLVHDGKLRYEDALTDIFPSFPDYGKRITIRNLLNHTSGLLDYEDLMEHHKFAVPPGTFFQINDDQVLELLEEQTSTKFQPGSRWDYSNSGYVVLGLVVKKVSGEAFGDFLRDRIFLPLGMKDTVLYEKGKNEVQDRAYGYSEENSHWRETDQSSTSATQGDGGMYSSVADLAKWDQALRSHHLLSESEMATALTPVNVPGVEEPDKTAAAYGFGWFLNPYKGHQRMWHYGETVGFRTAIERFPSDKLTVIVLANRADLDSNALALRLADVFLSR